MIDYTELENAIPRLGATLSQEEIREVFQAADVYVDRQLTFREFLVCLALGYLLGYIPIGADSTEAPLSETSDPTERAREILHTSTPADLQASLRGKDGRALVYSFQLALDAYMHLDVKRSGCVHRDEVVSSMSTLASLSPTGNVKHLPHAKDHMSSEILEFLSDERFRELDFDHDGNITFKEFLYAFFNWVGIDDEDDADEDEEENRRLWEATEAAGSASAAMDTSPDDS